ncbi:MAG: NYN domain-containing protein [Longimicrobiaceae bacterium]
MDRVAVFVDAGYLFAQGSILLAGRKLTRGEIRLEHEKAIENLALFAERVSGVKLLRVYWYDGTSVGPTPQHHTLAYLPNVKVRLGFVNSVGEQKGVDSLIVTDMITLARNHAIAEAVLLSGDEDLRVGVQQAQEFGVRVHLLGIKPSRGSQSIFLLQESDSTHEWSEADLAPFLSCSVRATEKVEVEVDVSGPQKMPSDILLEVAGELANEVPEGEIDGLVNSIRATRVIPHQLDGRLLARGRAALQQDLDGAQKKTAREAFLRACETRLAAIAVSKVLPATE